jgi:hypothetical protein
LKYDTAILSKAFRNLTYKPRLRGKAYIEWKLELRGSERVIWECVLEGGSGLNLTYLL